MYWLKSFLNYFNLLKNKKENIKSNITLDKLLSLTENEIGYIDDTVELKILLNKILKFSVDNNYKVFDNNQFDYNINIWFIRNKELREDTFNDVCFMFYKESKTDKWVGRLFRVTTNPGLPYLKVPLNKNGTAIIAPGQYIETHKIDIHNRGRSSAHEALCHRRGIVKVYRDNNKDSILDVGGVLYNDGRGLNFHQPTLYSERTGKVNRSSAGCLISRKRSLHNNPNDPLDVNTTMGLLRRARLNWGEWTSITLVDSNSLL